MNDNYKISENIIKFVYDLTGVKPKCDLIRDVGISKKSLVIQSDSQAIRPNFKLISRDDFVKNISGNSCWQGKINITCDGFISPCIMGNKYIDYSYNVKQNSLRQIMGEYVKKSFGIYLWIVSRYVGTVNIDMRVVIVDPYVMKKIKKQGSVSIIHTKECGNKLGILF